MADPLATPPNQPVRHQTTAGSNIGGYEIERELGRGGMGVVYLARQIKLNRRVALKMLTGHYGSDELARFMAEAETAAGLHHGHIAQIYEVGEFDGAPFFSMEYVEAGSLADRLRKEPIAPRETAQLLIQVARALHFAHQNGVVHRDMKPANILLDPEGVPKVADFGIAKRLTDDTKLTISGAIIGTPTYMAPEQAKGTSRHVGPAADVYSLGAILYEMLTGRPPFLPEESETAITVRVLTEDPVSPAWHHPGIPRDLEVICMKCLEKEPRDRYASAAAFAEDLRRFLDDETIVAKPPTTVVRTVKWVRRHPWKFVGAVAAIILATAGLARLIQWELYQRPHQAYAMGIDYRFGAPEPDDIRSASTAAHRAVNLRFRRRGRWGPVVKVESLNARGYPANVSQFFDYDALPNWIEGQLGLHNVPRKTREATSIDFLYDNRAITEEVAHDCNGMLTWHVVYDRASDNGSGRIHARYVTARGFDFASSGGASLIEFERDAAGRENKVTFFQGSGQPAKNGEGVYGYKLQRDTTGHVIRLTNLDEKGNPGSNAAGQITLVLHRNDRHLISRIEFRDASDKPVSSNGIFAVTIDYDSAGNEILTNRLDEKNQPTTGDARDWAAREISRNERGEITEIRFFSVNKEGRRTLVSRKNFGYDDRGYPSDIRFNGATHWHTHLKFDERGNVVEEILLGPDGKPKNGAAGWAIHRQAWQFSPEGSREVETWFDANEKPAYTKDGEHRRISEVDAAGNLHRYITDGHDPKRYRYQRYVCEPEYDAQGRERHMVLRFEDENGRPAVNAGLAYTSREITQDENERPILEWSIGANKQTMGAPVFRTETEWHRTGTQKRVIRQACDENRKPLPVISNGEAAHTEEYFSEIGYLERIYETGFDEKLVGFATREATFTNGTLLSVAHRRSDGTALDSVDVIIKAVNPKQPKAAELRPGDRFVSANGRPVTSTYAWAAAGEFPGGWIEIVRDGQQRRIEGFIAGPIDLALQDRAPKTSP